MSGDRPWMKFYPRDWRGDQALRAVSLAARGLWMECLCIMHEAKPYGHLLLNGETVGDVVLARMTGTSVDEAAALMAELRQAGVLSMTRGGVITSRRMIKDEAASKKGAKAVNKRWSQGVENEEKNTRPNRYPATKPSTHMPERREQKDSSLRSLSSAQAPEREKPAKRATRLPSDWRPDEAMVEYALGLGFTRAEIEIETEKIRDWSVNSPHGAKKDWSAAWRNWLKSSLERKSQHVGRRPVQAAEPFSSNPRVAQAVRSLRDGGWSPDPFSPFGGGDESDLSGGNSRDRALALFDAHAERCRSRTDDDGCIDGRFEVR